METILWLRRDGTGTERAVLVPDPNGYHLGGTAVFAHDGAGYEVRYSILTDPSWAPRIVGVHVQGPDGNRRLALRSDGDGNWTAEGEPVPALEGIIDVDLDFTPATNTLAIRRLALEVGDGADLDVAYLSFRGDDATTRKQRYERTDDRHYRYSSGDFAADLEVAPNGFVVEYPGLWQAVGAS